MSERRLKMIDKRFEGAFPIQLMMKVGDAKTLETLMNKILRLKNPSAVPDFNEEEIGFAELLKGTLSEIS